jgi:uncharacterized damage-inducible protein DinB
MEISNIETFIAYYKKIRQVTKQVIDVIPHDKLDWSYKPGKFTIGDIVRHIAAIERYVFAEVAIGNKPRYKGCGKEFADGHKNIVSYFDTMHGESLKIFKTVSAESLKKKISTLDGKEILLANFLRALIVHEVHHRGALCIYLNLLEVSTPPVLGLTEEQVKGLSY